MQKRGMEQTKKQKISILRLSHPTFVVNSFKPQHNSVFQRMRLLALERDKYKCQKCSSEAKTVHHIDGNRKNNKLVNLQTLCKSCHQKLPKLNEYKTSRAFESREKTTSVEGKREYMKNYMKAYRGDHKK